MSIQIKGLAFVFHPVTDLAKARKFYEGVLGLKVGMEFDFGGGKGWVEYDLDGQALAISNWMSTPAAHSLALEVGDIDAAFSAAKAASVTADKQIMDTPGCRMFNVKDPDGNEITLHFKKPRA